MTRARIYWAEVEYTESGGAGVFGVYNSAEVVTPALIPKEAFGIQNPRSIRGKVL